MENKATVLVVEDEAGISNFISAVLDTNGYRVIVAKAGGTAIAMSTSACPDIILLDLGLPDMDGIEVLKKIREWFTIPVIVVSARWNEREKVEALDAGADDYVTKPFGTAELLARIRAVVRRKQKNGSPEAAHNRIRIGDLEIDNGKRLIFLSGKEVHFTPIEYKLILLLAEHAGRVLTIDYITKEVWGPYTREENALRVNMANIRRKIEVNPAEPKYILTEVGVGYRMVEDL